MPTYLIRNKLHCRQVVSEAMMGNFFLLLFLKRKKRKGRNNDRKFYENIGAENERRLEMIGKCIKLNLYY